MTPLTAGNHVVVGVVNMALLWMVHCFEMLLPQGIVGQHHFLSFCEGWTSVFSTKENIETPFLCILRIQFLSQLPLSYIHFISSVNKLPKQKRLFNRNSSLY